ncbi:hypothetical protein AAMO2058_000188600 [Amorphochlora amoebiformis]
MGRRIDPEKQARMQEWERKQASKRQDQREVPHCDEDDDEDEQEESLQNYVLKYLGADSKEKTQENRAMNLARVVAGREKEGGGGARGDVLDVGDSIFRVDTGEGVGREGSPWIVTAASLQTALYNLLTKPNSSLSLPMGFYSVQTPINLSPDEIWATPAPSGAEEIKKDSPKASQNPEPLADPNPNPNPNPIDGEGVSNPEGKGKGKSSVVSKEVEADLDELLNLDGGEGAKSGTVTFAEFDKHDKELDGLLGV